MPYTPNNPLVPGDPYSYDLKWMVEETKKAIAVGESAKADAESAAASAVIANNKANLAAAMKDEAEAWAIGTKDSAPVSSDAPQYNNNSKYYSDQAVIVKADVDAQLRSQDDEIATLVSRMDTFSNLPNASTAGDAELQDIRVGYNGVVYPNAGDAVRGQISDLHLDVNTLDSDVYDIDTFDWSSIGNASYPYGFRTGYYDPDDGSAVSSSHYLRSRTHISFDGFSKITLKAPAGFSFGILEYDDTDTFVRPLCYFGLYTDPSDGTTSYTFNPIPGYKYGITLSGWNTIANADITQTLVDGWILRRFHSKVDEEISKCRAIYELGPYNYGRASERIKIYVPTESGYIRYDMYHFEDGDVNSNCWQLYHIYRCNDALTGDEDLTVTAEYECAVRLAGWPNFVGGHVHGNEVINNMTVLIDGVPVAIGSGMNSLLFDKITLIETSTLYDIADGTTPIADHGRQYDFTIDGLNLKQSLKWRIAASLDNCYMAMFPPSKDWIDRGAVNSDFEVIELSSDAATPLTTVIKENADKITLWDTNTRVSAIFGANKYPTGLVGGDRITISDNEGMAYNKVYIKVCGGGTSSVGELWLSDTYYKMTYRS